MMTVIWDTLGTAALDLGKTSDDEAQDKLLHALRLIYEAIQYVPEYDDRFIQVMSDSGGTVSLCLKQALRRLFGDSFNPFLAHDIIQILHDFDHESHEKRLLVNGKLQYGHHTEQLLRTRKPRLDKNVRGIVSYFQKRQGI
ncbi:hypothetical protein MUP01_12125 [Candidatus Bathyarchaeota archaeon]|nr:hypothetical protein [Candidatus Bathyarchaeota archaeon]